ncbi:glycogen synthase GlgA [Mangrovibacillus cuniculi]|uniref:Glycogen synthase n=1 Tax=Mangrovibacillus cuniculi TaxID=2593652 RepID=A0A7S8CC94_9BACI|nr:glycogen synthase GlgA [Mangrovibacillus cuniculi]QPC47324.1 glycogen synthase GlgA [Mangrovibacillus cuniculi]
MNILFIVGECAPFIKSGGLADVAGSLPKSLNEIGHDVRVVMPKYADIHEKYTKEMKLLTNFKVSLGWRNAYCGVEMLVHDGVTYYFIDNEQYFNREGLYGYDDDGERFSFFNRAVLDMLSKISYKPEVLHCHDWHTGMIPFLYRTEYQYYAGMGQMKTVYTIHNLKYQGIFPQSVMSDLLGIPDVFYHPDYLEFHGNISFMKAALVASDKITTVSPTYRDEIMHEYAGEKLEGLLRFRANDVIGIVNGIDDKEYNPADDPSIPLSYHADNWSGKVAAKTLVQETFGLPVNPSIPLVVMISRLTEQKGIDLIQHVFSELVNEKAQWIFLGSGEWHYEQWCRDMTTAYPNKVRSWIGFHEEMAHRLYAASDFFLMPSRFEPCGLGQLIAMRYGSVPIVRETGGLNDTVQSYNEKTKQGNGFSFSNYNAHDMLHTIRRAFSFYEDEERFSPIIRQAMETDVSWTHSAKQYRDLYHELITGSESHVF